MPSSSEPAATNDTDVPEDDDSNVTYTLDNVCEKAADSYCPTIKSCCETLSLTYEEAGCRANLMKDCKGNTDAVTAGTQSFHADKVDGCLKAVTEVYGACPTEVAPDNPDFAAFQTACSGMFVGTIAQGEACESSADCAPSANANERAKCDGTCTVTTLLQDGDSCSFSGSDAFCDSGLYCTADASVPDSTGQCEAVVAVGEACVLSAPGMCGTGYCDTTTTICSARKPAGGTCTGSFECESYQCTADVCEENPNGGLLRQEQCDGTSSNGN